MAPNRYQLKLPACAACHDTTRHGTAHCCRLLLWTSLRCTCGRLASSASAATRRRWASCCGAPRTRCGSATPSCWSPAPASWRTTCLDAGTETSGCETSMARCVHGGRGGPDCLLAGCMGDTAWGQEDEVEGAGAPCPAPCPALGLCVCCALAPTSIKPNERRSSSGRCSMRGCPLLAADVDSSFVALPPALAHPGMHGRRLRLSSRAPASFPSRPSGRGARCVVTAPSVWAQHTALHMLRGA